MSDWDLAETRPVDEPVDDPERPMPAPRAERPIDVPEADALEQSIDVDLDDELLQDDERPVGYDDR